MILDKILEWAKDNDNIVSVISTGSHSRDDNKTDQFSDYDVELIANDNKSLANSNDWIHNFGRVVIIKAFDEGQDYPTRSAIFDGGIKVDFTLGNKQRLLNMKQNGLDSLYNRGFKVLIDKIGITNELNEPSGAPTKNIPTEKEYLDTINEFFFEVAHMPKYLLRKDLWVVKFRDWTMKEMLLKMLEWYTVSKDPSKDVWHIGSHMKDWLDNETWQELSTVYSRFEVSESWQSLLASIKLFRRISKVVGDKFHLQYPEDTDKGISDYILGYKDKFEQ